MDVGAAMSKSGERKLKIYFKLFDQKDDKSYYYANSSDRFQPRSALVDTGCNHTLLFTSIEPFLDERKQSRLQIQVADKGSSMIGSKDGVLRALAFGAEGVSSGGTNLSINCSMQSSFTLLSL